jgi:hypothetical protein
MNFADTTIIRIADPSTRSAVFDQVALEQLLRAAYTVDLNLGGPYSAAFDEFQIGVPIPRSGTAQGFWSGLGGADPREIRVELVGIGADTSLRADALWRGSIVARLSPVTDHIASIQTAWPTAAGIDAEIAAALGALPADPLVLEHERRVRYLARLRGALAQPDVMTETALDRWLREAGANTVGDLIERLNGSAAFGATRVTYSLTAAPPPSPHSMPVAVALIVRDVGFSLADLLLESKQVRDRLEPIAAITGSQPLAPRNSLVVAWIVPSAVFDDTAWPTLTNPAAAADQRRERRQLAGTWLAREGIGLIVI